MEEEIYFTKEELDELYPAEIHFESVLKQSQLRGAPSWLTKQVSQIYKARFNKPLNKNYNCQVCAFSIYKIVGKEYFKSKEHYNTLSELVVEPAEETPKKSKRSKK